ncbi:MAG TPA: tripartite tricarboxylate transporter substrate-binding protein [Burkholderiales bacterium]|nr:tripartite tricarboxylate transporter substrate-binding protein [Burkholderiales bacterium]
MKHVRSRKSRVVHLCLMGCALLAAQQVHAQAYPSKNIQMIVPYTPGGSADLFSRVIARRLGETWGRTVVVENRPGASGMIGTEIVTKAAPDGYMLLGHTSSYPATASVRAKLPFDPARAIVPVAMIARAPMLIAVHPSVPAKSVKELIAVAKRTTGGLNYGSSGAGGNNHFASSLFAAAAGIQMTHIPYKGISLAVTALASGEIEVLMASQAALAPQIQGNRVRVLAVTSAKPSPLYPGLPPAAAGGAPGYSYELWWGVFAPAGMAADRLAFINAAINKILGDAEMKKLIAREGAEPWPLDPKQLDGLLVREIERYRKAAKIAGIKPL